MRYRLQRHDGTDCSATMVPITVLRMVPIQRYRQFILLRTLLAKISHLPMGYFSISFSNEYTCFSKKFFYNLLNSLK